MGSEKGDAPEKYLFCLNSRRWVLWFDMYGLPNSCPQKGYQGNTNCVGPECGYCEEREPSPHLKRLLKVFRSLGRDEQSGQE